MELTCGYLKDLIFGSSEREAMTIPQKLREDLRIEQLEVDKASRAVEAAQAHLREHEIRLRYIKECLSIGQNGQSAPAPERKSANTQQDVEQGDATDIAQLIQRAFESGNRKMRVTDVVKRVIQEGYGSPADQLKVSKSVGAFLMRRARKPDGGYKRLSRGLFEYVGEPANGNSLY